jgi:hypothetical protein
MDSVEAKKEFLSKNPNPSQNAKKAFRDIYKSELAESKVVTNKENTTTPQQTQNFQVGQAPRKVLNEAQSETSKNIKDVVLDETYQTLTADEKRDALKKATEKALNTYSSRFIDKANSIDTEKLKTVRDMFEQMAEFSKSVHGDFDRLADVLSEKLCDVLEKLQKTLDDVANMDFPSPAPNGGGDPKDPNSPSGGDKNKDKKLDKNFKDIKDSLEDMISLLTSVKNNTDSL